ncbi:MAG: TIGR02147 family protein [Bdellovibrionales bacterium]|nr:TIGR02147 family protein [Bdellovibrionales bacterium]
MASIFEYDDIVGFLKAVYGEKKKKNYTFSLRSYGKDLDISASHLLRVLHGKKHLSLGKAMSIAKKLNLSPTETNYLLLLAQKDIAKDDKIKSEFVTALAKKKRENMRLQLDAESLEEFTDWLFFALLALIRTIGFKNDTNWITKRLNISSKQLSEAIAKLRKRKMIEISPQEEISLPHSINLHLQGGYAKRLITQTARQQEQDESHLSALTLVVNPKDLPRAKQLISEFINNFNDEIDSLDGNEVFQLNLQFYQLTQKEP